MMSNNKLKNKRYYTITEVCSYCNIQPYTLRYWENKIPSLSPQRFGSNRRHYTKEMIQIILVLKSLIVEQGYSVSGAKKYLSEQDQQIGCQSLMDEIISIIHE